MSYYRRNNYTRRYNNNRYRYSDYDDSDSDDYEYFDYDDSDEDDSVIIINNIHRHSHYHAPNRNITNNFSRQPSSNTPPATINNSTTSLAWYVVSFNDPLKLKSFPNISMERYSYKIARNGSKYLTHIICFKQPISYSDIKRIYPTSRITIPDDINACWNYVGGTIRNYS